ncbi:coat protein [Dulcamara mottle virus]|uniref:Capsid protein n=1 Tax=Dulcamara mottle virus TaxID=70823 RepID=O89519_9VIRU|nr:coat protein [Dulcamara mottle virus]AAC25019.1 virion protein [Dulcamara mottle virus]AAW65471.1 coat protein [Dulcamara mottle virus]
MDESKIVTVKQPSISAPGFTLSAPEGEQAGSIRQIFQFEATSVGVVETLAQVSLSASESLAKLTAGYRRAKLVELFLTITPTQLAIDNPVTVDVVWVPANSTATPSKILSVYGGQRFLIGGTLTTSQVIRVPCNLQSVNAMIKDSTIYTDSPKLLVYSPVAKGSPKTPSATVQIAGQILLSAPLLQAL